MLKKNKKAHSLQSTSVMAAANLDAWFHSPRVWIMLICVFIYCWMQAANDTDTLQVNGMQILFSYPEMLFIKLNSGFYIMASILFLVMVSELPRRISFQNYMLSRTTRHRWVLSLCVYCAFIVVLMILFLILFYSAFALPHAASTNGYAENALIESNQMVAGEAMIPAYIRQNVSPGLACILAIVPMFFFWMTMLLIILFFGLLGYPLIGPIVYGFLLLAHVTILYEALPVWLKLPIAFSTLQNITVDYTGEEFSRILKVVIGYLVLDGGLVAMLSLLGKNADLYFSSANRD